MIVCNEQIRTYNKEATEKLELLPRVNKNKTKSNTSNYVDRQLGNSYREDGALGDDEQVHNTDAHITVNDSLNEQVQLQQDSHRVTKSKLLVKSYSHERKKIE